jgi:hypothetical protein
MPMDVYPDRGGGIQIRITFQIIDIGTFSAFDNERGVAVPFLHLSKRVPHILAIVFL